MENKKCYTPEEIKSFFEIYLDFNKKVRDFTHFWSDQRAGIVFLYPKSGPAHSLELDKSETREYLDIIERLESAFKQYEEKIPEEVRNIFINPGFPNRLELIRKEAREIRTEREKMLEVLTREC